MLEQRTYETPFNGPSLRCLLKILFPPQVHTRETVGDGATGESEVAGSEHQSFVRQIEATAVLCQVEVREQGPYDFSNGVFGCFG